VLCRRSGGWWGGVLDAGATIRVVASTLGTDGAIFGTGGAALVTGAGGGGSVGIGGTIERCARSGVGSVAGIVRELLSQSEDGVTMGSVGGTGMSEGSSAGGSAGT
jgi:hypothetical protein